MAFKFTQEVYDLSATKGMKLDDAVASVHKKEVDEIRASGDDRRLVEIAMENAGFDSYSNMYDIFNYSQSTMNNDILFPAYIDTVLQEIRTANPQDIIYPSLIAGETTIPSDSYKGTYMDFGTDGNKKAMMWQGVAEGADIPFVQVKTGEKSLKVYKNAIGVKQTYEAMRRITIDIAQEHLNRLARRFGSQNLDEVIYTMINGDGNDNAIPSDLKFTTTTAGTWTANDLITASINFNDVSEGLNADTYLCTKGAFSALLQLLTDNDKFNGFAPGAAFTFPQEILNGARVFYVRNLPLATGSKDRILMLNKANGIRKMVEGGSLISESKTESTNQTVYYTMSENAVFQKLDKYSVAELVSK